MKAHKVCVEIVDYLLHMNGKGYRIQITRRDIEKAIMHVRGIDPRTVNKWLKALLTFDYIKLKAPNVYEFNPFKVPELFTLLKEKPQTKLQ